MSNDVDPMTLGKAARNAFASDRERLARARLASSMSYVGESATFEVDDSWECAARAAVHTAFASIGLTEDGTVTITEEDSNDPVWQNVTIDEVRAILLALVPFRQTGGSPMDAFLVAKEGRVSATQYASSPGSGSIIKYVQQIAQYIQDDLNVSLRVMDKRIRKLEDHSRETYERLNDNIEDRIDFLDRRFLPFLCCVSCGTWHEVGMDCPTCILARRIDEIEHADRPVRTVESEPLSEAKTGAKAGEPVAQCAWVRMSGLRCRLPLGHDGLHTRDDDPAVLREKIDDLVRRMDDASRPPSKDSASECSGCGIFYSGEACSTCKIKSDIADLQSRLSLMESDDAAKFTRAYNEERDINTLRTHALGERLLKLTNRVDTMERETADELRAMGVKSVREAIGELAKRISTLEFNEKRRQ